MLANESAIVRGFSYITNVMETHETLDSNVVMPTMSNELLMVRVERRALGAKNKTR